MSNQEPWKGSDSSDANRPGIPSLQQYVLVLKDGMIDL